MRWKSTAVTKDHRAPGSAAPTRPSYVDSLHYCGYQGYIIIVCLNLRPRQGQMNIFLSTLKVQRERCKTKTHGEFYNRREKNIL